MHLSNLLKKKMGVLDEKLINLDNACDPIYNDSNGLVKNSIHRIPSRLPADVNFDLMENEILQKQLTQRIKVNKILSFGHLNRVDTQQHIATDYGSVSARGSGLGGDVSLNNNEFLEGLNYNQAQKSKFKVGQFFKKDSIIKEVINSPNYPLEGDLSNPNGGLKIPKLDPKRVLSSDSTLTTQKVPDKKSVKREKNKIDADKHKYQMVDNRVKIDQN